MKKVLSLVSALAYSLLMAGTALAVTNEVQPSADPMLGTWKLEYPIIHTLSDTAVGDVFNRGLRLDIVHLCEVTVEETDEETGEEREWTDQWYVGTVDGYEYNRVYIHSWGTQTFVTIGFVSLSGEETYYLHHEFRNLRDSIFGHMNGSINYPYTEVGSEWVSESPTSLNGTSKVSKVSNLRTTLTKDEEYELCEYYLYEETDEEG